VIKLFVSAIQRFGGGKTLEEFKHMRAEIYQALEFYANVDTRIEILSEGPQAALAEEARTTYRQMAAKVSSFKELPFYNRWLLPSPENLRKHGPILSRFPTRPGILGRLWRTLTGKTASGRLSKRRGELRQKKEEG
jgi:hypothetical protein